jgi:two-component system alkaline phosphatase synthesis response regulator PhoP
MTMKILVADDERDIRDLIAFTLQFAGYQVVSAADGQEAVELAIKELPDLILMDVRMPRMSGYEACRRIKAESTLQDVPIVFLSAKGQETEIRLGLEAGAQEYVVKPFAPAELVERVKHLLTKYG